jgi:hypothetical protein
MIPRNRGFSERIRYNFGEFEEPIIGGLVGKKISLCNWAVHFSTSLIS